MKSSIIDVPRKHTQDDLFGIQVYQDALIEYIRLTDTPITIALQGEWGSGKTSLMNLSMSLKRLILRSGMILRELLGEIP